MLLHRLTFVTCYFLYSYHFLSLLIHLEISSTDLSSISLILSCNASDLKLNISVEFLVWCALFFVLAFYFYYFLMFTYFWERERQSTSRGGADREGGTEPKAGSRLWAVEMLDHDLSRSSNDWATQAPLILFFKFMNFQFFFYKFQRSREILHRVMFPSPYYFIVLCLYHHMVLGHSWVFFHYIFCFSWIYFLVCLVIFDWKKLWKYYLPLAMVHLTLW